MKLKGEIKVIGVFQNVQANYVDKITNFFGLGFYSTP